MRDREAKKARKAKKPSAVPDDGHSPYVPKFESEWEQTTFRKSLFADLLDYMALAHPEDYQESLEEDRKRNPTPFFPGFLEAYREANRDYP